MKNVVMKKGRTVAAEGSRTVAVALGEGGGGRAERRGAGAAFFCWSFQSDFTNKMVIRNPT